MRLEGHDYSAPGNYFVTICSKELEFFFGDVINFQMHLNEPGLMTQKWWLEISNKFKTVKLDQYIIMPNHIQGIIQISKNDLEVRADRRVRPAYNPTKNVDQQRNEGRTHRSARTSISKIIQLLTNGNDYFNIFLNCL